MLDADISKYVIGWIHEETGIPPLAAKATIKLLAIGGVMIGKASGHYIVKLLCQTPYWCKIKDGSHIDKLLAYLDKEKKVNKELKDLLDGHRPIHDMHFAEHLNLELRLELKQLGELSILSEKIDGLERWLKPQSTLKLNLLAGDADDLNRFSYGRQKAQFVGREEELIALQGFLSAQVMFFWWMVTGEGGQGKSRVALELCLRSGGGWRSGFLPKHYDSGFFQEWVPNQPTLLIADHAAAQASRLGEIIQILSDRSENGEFAVPVRLLLLERNYLEQAEWLKALRGVRNERYMRESKRHLKEDLVIKSLDDASLCRII